MQYSTYGTLYTFLTSLLLSLFSCTLNGNTPQWEISEQLSSCFFSLFRFFFFKWCNSGVKWVRSGCSVLHTGIASCCTLLLTLQRHPHLSLCAAALCDNIADCISVTGWKWKTPFVMCRQELEKAGLLNKTKIAEGGKKLRWGSSTASIKHVAAHLECICFVAVVLKRLKVSHHLTFIHVVFCFLQEELEPFLGSSGWEQSGFL